MLRINDILDKVQSYLSPSEIGMIEKAYIFSASVHQGQIRLSGEPYLTHPMEVCGILADMKLESDGMAFSEEIKIEAVRNSRIRFGEISIQYSSRVGETKLNPWRDGFHNLAFLLKKRFLR